MARLQKLAERVYPESQCGIRAERSTVDMIVSLRQLQEKCREQQMPLYVAFIDLTKVFDFQQRRPLQYPAKGWLIEPPPPPPQQHAGDCAVQRQHLWTFQRLQRGQTGLRPCSHSLRDLLRFASEARIRYIKRRDLPPYEITWQAFQSRPPQSHDQST